MHGWSTPATTSRCQGKVVQVDPVKPTLKAPGTKRLKLKCVKLLSGFAPNSACAATSRDHEAVALTIAELGRAVPVEPMKPMLKLPGTERLKL